jgi:hypothetical protein
MIEYMLVVVAAHVGWSLVCLEINYRRALPIGIPLLRMPVDPLNIPFQVIEPHISKVIDRLPSVARRLLPNSVPYLRRGWFFIDKAKSHVRYGPVFAFCHT